VLMFAHSDWGPQPLRVLTTSIASFGLSLAVAGDLDVKTPADLKGKRIGEDVSEKLDYTPGVFTVERHIRGKWVCDQCETLIQAPVPAQIIDKGILSMAINFDPLLANRIDPLAHR